jgi:YidC/Oxa1 family membrane protein insertase
MFDFIYEVFGQILAFFYSLIPDLGVAIILLTIVVMLVLYPLTAKQAKSMMAMQRLQPEIKKLQAKYKGDRQKLNEETMKLYQENKVNPLAGCLPLLVQLPIFFSLFRVLKDTFEHVPKSSDLYADLCHGFGNLCGKTVKGDLIGQFPGFKKGETLVHALGFIDRDFLNLRLTATDPHGGVIHAAPYFILVLLVMATGFLQTRQAQKRTPQVNKSMGMVMKILPVFFGLISLNFPAGLVLYFFVSNLFRLGQQEIIFRRHGSALHGPGGKPLDVKSTERDAKPPAPAPRQVAAPEPPDEPQRSAPRNEPAKTQQAPTTRAGGLRGRLAMPPPPGGNGGPDGQPAAQGSGAGTRGDPSSRKRRKKKRKR